MEIKRERKENMRGGSGHVIMEHILGKAELGDKCRLYARVILEKGCSIGCHEHHKESETYFILSGQGVYEDDGRKRIVNPGDVTYTPDGHSHGMANEGEEALVFMALILPE